MQNPEFLAQVAHVMLGALLVRLALDMGQFIGVMVTVLFILYSCVKEMVVDPLYETDNPFWWSGFWDMTALLSGASLSWMWWYLIVK